MTQLRSIIIGLAVTIVLLGMLVATRMMVLVSHEKEYEIRDVDIVKIAEPPPPAPDEMIQEDDIPPPPAPSIVDLSTTFDVNQPPISVSPVHVDPRLSVQTFFTDQAPAPIIRAKPRPKKVKTSTHHGVKLNKHPRVHTVRVKKKNLTIADLDQKPRILHHPSVRFPRSIHGTSRGRVLVRVSISPSGRSRCIAILSSSHPALIPLARKIANGSRFTTPTRHGKPVSATMDWPINIQK